MVSYLNGTVSIYAPTVTVNSEGTKIKTFTSEPVAVFQADVQPHTLSETEREIWGLSSKTAEVKRIFYDGVQPYMVRGNRATVADSVTGVTSVYNIQPVNTWPNHGEALLVPVQGEGA